MKTKQFLYLFIILLVFQLSSCRQTRKERKSSSIIQAEQLNLENEDQKNLIEIDFLKLTGDTIFVPVKNDEVLTKQSETYGADEYLGIIVRSLTEIKKIVEIINFKY